MNNNALVLCSGGPDAFVAADMLKKEGFQLTFLHFNYRQKAGYQEYEASLRCARYLDIPVRYLETGLLGHNASHLLKGTTAPKTVQQAWVPCRNLILLSIAAGIAEVRGYSHLVIGNIKDGAYPDNKPAFRDAFDEVLKHASASTIRCLAPVNDLTKAEVIAMGHDMGLPLEITWSCFEGGDVHCGVCGSCVKRRQAFKDAKVEDKTIYAQ